MGSRPGHVPSGRGEATQTLGAAGRGTGVVRTQRQNQPVRTRAGALPGATEAAGVTDKSRSLPVKTASRHGRNPLPSPLLPADHPGSQGAWELSPVTQRTRLGRRRQPRSPPCAGRCWPEVTALLTRGRRAPPAGTRHRGRSWGPAGKLYAAESVEGLPVPPPPQSRCHCAVPSRHEAHHGRLAPGHHDCDISGGPGCHWLCRLV